MFEAQHVHDWERAGFHHVQIGGILGGTCSIYALLACGDLKDWKKKSRNTFCVL